LTRVFRSEVITVGGFPLPLTRQDGLHIRLPDRLWFELDLHSVVGVISTDFGEDDLEDTLLVFVGHDRPVVDDGLQLTFGRMTAADRCRRGSTCLCACEEN